MPDAFKDSFDDALVDRYAEQFAGPGFDTRAFRDAVQELEPLALKARVECIADALATALPPSFPDAIEVLGSRLPEALPGTEAVASTFGWWPLCTFVERHGLAHADQALTFLHRLTKTFSAEFAVRPYLRDDLDGTLTRLTGWLDDPNPHVRRWISEGTRPRLPWGLRLRTIAAAPHHTLPLLDALVDDPELYVRRSVANHLGDIAKDHPDVAVEQATSWVGGGPVPARGGSHRDWVVRHGLRHLIKQGHPGALALMGFAPAEVHAELQVSEEVHLGEALEVSLTLSNPTAKAQRLLIDLAIVFLGAKGAPRRPKVFKWTTLDLEPGVTRILTRKQKLAKVTTRTHHEGTQQVLAQVNGKAVAEAAFELRT